MRTSKIKIALVLISTILLAGACRVGGKYQQPDIDLPTTFNGENIDSGGVAELSRDVFFKDSLLLQLIDTSLRYNQDLLVAINRMDIARTRMAQAKLLQLPSVDFQIGGQYNRPSKNSLNGISANSFLGKSHIENYLAIMSLSWEADIWGKIRNMKETAVANYLEQTEAARAIETQLVSDVAQGYYNLLMLDRQLEIAKSNLILSDSFVSATRMLKDAGVVSLLAVEQAEYQRQATDILIPALEQDIALQENALKLLTGKLPGRVERNLLAQSNIENDLSTGVPVELLKRRPDVRAAEMALVAANAQAGVAKANMYPALNITAGAGLESFKSSNWFNIPGSLFGLAAGTIVQPVFRRNALKRDYEVAKLEREQAVTRFRQQVLNAVIEVSNALVRIDKLQQQQKIAIAQVDTLNTAARNARLLFGSDMATYLEVLTAQGNSLQAQLNLSAIRRNEVAARIELYRALGGGWK
jgi:multidrug efflux system outer membrane protein